MLKTSYRSTPGEVDVYSKQYNFFHCCPFNFKNIFFIGLKNRFTSLMLEYIFLEQWFWIWEGQWESVDQNLTAVLFCEIAVLMKYDDLPSCSQVIPFSRGSAWEQPPPDLASYLYKNRIVYLGMSLVPSVTELILAEFLYLQYEDEEKPIYLYINSTGTTKVMAYVFASLLYDR